MISNKLIGLAALAFLCGSAGFTAVGCTSTVTQSGGDDDDDAGPTSSSSGGRPRPDGGNTSGDGGEPASCQPATTYTDSWVDAAVANPASCTTAEITAFNTTAETSGATFEQLYAVTAGACRACIFTDVGNFSTEPTSLAAIGIVTAGAQKGGGIVNSGWCLANKAGKPACGNAYGAFQQCGDSVCKDCGEAVEGEDDEDRAACKKTAYTGATSICIASTEASLNSACGADGLAFESECSSLSLLDQIADLCSGGAGDGGVADAGRDAN